MVAEFGEHFVLTDTPAAALRRLTMDGWTDEV